VYCCFDVLVRVLRHLGYSVTYVRNFTDIDDKIIARAREAGEDPLALAQRCTPMHTVAHACCARSSPMRKWVRKTGSLSVSAGHHRTSQDIRVAACQGTYCNCSIIT
jgi:hypothetical protein